MVTAFTFLATMANFLPRTPRVRKAVGTWIIARRIHPRPSLYATPGPPTKLLALVYVVMIAMARTKPPMDLPPIKYSSRNPPASGALSATLFPQTAIPKTRIRYKKRGRIIFRFSIFTGPLSLRDHRPLWRRPRRRFGPRPRPGWKCRRTRRHSCKRTMREAP